MHRQVHTLGPAGSRSLRLIRIELIPAPLLSFFSVLSFSRKDNMSKEQNAATLTKFAEAVNTANYDLFNEAVAPNCVDHDPAPGQVPGPEGYRTLFSEMRGAFPDMQVAVDTMVADEESIAFAYTFTGTQNGPFMGIPGSGKKVSMRGLQISKFSSGKMVERWGSSDQLGLLQQIGATITR